MLVFLALSFLYLIGWAMMFLSATFRWTFMYWRFFSVITSASVFLTLMALVVGIWCRMNFGKGLKRHCKLFHFMNFKYEFMAFCFSVQGQERLSDGDTFAREDEKLDVEKVEFPSTEWPLPTYSDFGSESQLSAPNQAHFATPRMGPRFFNQSLEPFDSSPRGSHKYSPSSDSGHSTLDVPRSNSRSSHHSRSSSSGKSDSSYHSPRRWVIE